MKDDASSNGNPVSHGGGSAGEGGLVRWASSLREALLAVLVEDDVDVDDTSEPGTLVVSTDEWDLRVEGLDGPRPTALLMIDDEPDDPARFAAARRAVLPEAVERALAAADDTLAGALRRALLAGGDPFSQDLATALSAVRPDPLTTNH